MTGFLQAHHARRGVLLAAAAGLLSLVLAGRAVTLPQLLEGLVRPVDVGLIVALAFAPLTAYVFGGEALALEALAVRRLGRADSALVAVLLSPVVLAASLLAGLGDGASALAVLRDDVTFTAITLALLALLSPAAAAGLPVAYFLAVATLGVRADGSTPWWAWLRAEGTPATAVVSLALLAGGTSLFHARGRHRPAVQHPSVADAL